MALGLEAKVGTGFLEGDFKRPTGDKGFDDEGRLQG